MCKKKAREEIEDKSKKWQKSFVVLEGIKTS